MTWVKMRISFVLLTYKAEMSEYGFHHTLNSSPRHHSYPRELHAASDSSRFRRLCGQILDLPARLDLEQVGLQFGGFDQIAWRHV